MDNSVQNYQAVLRDLELRRSRCQEELADIDQTIAGIRKLLAKDASLFAQVPLSAAGAPPKYAGMSVRWAVLKYLAEEAVSAVPTSIISATLRQDGMNTRRGADFSNNVSAVISNMVRVRGELESVNGAYRLTESGKRAWETIKLTPQYRSRNAGASIVQ